MPADQRRPRAHVEIDGQEIILGSDRDLVHVMAQIEAAAASSPAFVDLSDGDRLISVLILPTTRVVIRVESASETETELVPFVSPIDDWDM